MPINDPATIPGRLHELAVRAIAASTMLTAASIAGALISNAQYARLDHAAHATRQHLLDCLAQDHGIDPAMSERLGALL